MMIRFRVKVALVWGLFFCLIGCVHTTDIEKTENSMPGGWSPMLLTESGMCTSIDGEYQTRGQGRLEKDAAFVEMRLDVALGHTFPTGKIPGQVSLAIDEGANQLGFQFGDPVNSRYTESVSCSHGWYVIEQRRKDQYVGDGTKLDYMLRKIRLAKANDGSLIVHLKLEGQFSSSAVLKSREASESWSKYDLLR